MLTPCDKALGSGTSPTNADAKSRSVVRSGSVVVSGREATRNRPVIRAGMLEIPDRTPNFCATFVVDWTRASEPSIRRRASLKKTDFLRYSRAR